MLTLMPTHHPDTAMGTATEAGTAIDSDVDSLVVDTAARTLTTAAATVITLTGTTEGRLQ